MPKHVEMHREAEKLAAVVCVMEFLRSVEVEFAGQMPDLEGIVAVPRNRSNPAAFYPVSAGGYNRLACPTRRGVCRIGQRHRRHFLIDQIEATSIVHGVDHFRKLLRVGERLGVFVLSLKLPSSFSMTSRRVLGSTDLIEPSGN